ncbi:MAG: type II toxin-antitoxin system HicA family toxin [Dongiaceae bacterium]
MVKVATAFGFVHDRTVGSHRIFNHPGLPGMLNLQPDGNKAKPYQVRQLVKLVEKYRLSLRAGPTAEDE